MSYRNTENPIKTGVVSTFTAIAVAVSAMLASPVIFAEGLQLEEITVTARKREESLQETPIAVSAVTAELKSASLRDVQQLADYAPICTLKKMADHPVASISVFAVWNIPKLIKALIHPLV